MPLCIRILSIYKKSVSLHKLLLCIVTMTNNLGVYHPPLFILCHCALHSAALLHVKLYYTLLHFNAQHCSAVKCTDMNNTKQNCTTLQWIVLYSTVPSIMGHLLGVTVTCDCNLLVSLQTSKYSVYIIVKSCYPVLHIMLLTDPV